ncbi:MAG: PDZ domain-containing protein, partial [Myxococcota bacterium]
MRNTVLPLTLALLALPAVASAGHDEECTAELQTCIDSMVAELKSTGFIGVELDEKKGTKDLVVTKVVTGAPAEAAGIKDGDVL